MANFASAYPSLEAVPRYAAQLPRQINMMLMDRIKDDAKREWYAEKTWRKAGQKMCRYIKSTYSFAKDKQLQRRRRILTRNYLSLRANLLLKH